MSTSPILKRVEHYDREFNDVSLGRPYGTVTADGYGSLWYGKQVIDETTCGFGKRSPAEGSPQGLGWVYDNVCPASMTERAPSKNRFSLVYSLKATYTTDALLPPQIYRDLYATIGSGMEGLFSVAYRLAAEKT